MSEVNWRRTLGASSLVMALLLIAGSIYLHVRQKHHLGRLRHDHQQRVEPTVGVDAAVIVAPFQADAHAGELSDTLRQRQHTDCPVAAATNSATNIDEACLQCICETATECQPTTCSSSAEPCGVFRISRPYWYDAGKPTLAGDRSSVDSFDEGYAHCVNNAFCAARTVAAYLGKYRRDCNQDGVIDCRDLATLHVLGPSGCVTKELMPVFENRMENCLAAFEEDDNDDAPQYNEKEEHKKQKEQKEEHKKEKEKKP